MSACTQYYNIQSYVAMQIMGAWATSKKKTRQNVSPKLRIKRRTFSGFPLQKVFRPDKFFFSIKFLTKTQKSAFYAAVNCRIYGEYQNKISYLYIK